MKDEEDDNIVPEGQEDDNTSAEEGLTMYFLWKPTFYDNQEDGNDTITKVTGMYKDWFLVIMLRM
jgi:topoisomerase-4 subunit A